MSRVPRSNEVKRKALATLAHEVKTPVAGIRLSLHLLLEGKVGALNENQRELLEVSRENCERLLALVQAGLELARLETGETEFSPESCPPAELLAEVKAARGEAGQPDRGELVLETAAGLPPVIADLKQATRLLGNFLSNAGKFGTPGRPVVLRASARDDGHVRLSVVNHGRPLSALEQARVFDPFFRRPGGNAEGTGLSLAICREIAALHGGRVGVTCPPDSDLVEFFLDLRVAG